MPEVAGVGFGCGSHHGGGQEENCCSYRDTPHGGACHSSEPVLSWVTQTGSVDLVMEWILGNHLSSIVHHLHELDVHLDYYRCELPELQQWLPLPLLLYRYGGFDGESMLFGG